MIFAFHQKPEIVRRSDVKFRVGAKISNNAAEFVIRLAQCRYRSNSLERINWAVLYHNPGLRAPLSLSLSLLWRLIFLINCPRMNALMPRTTELERKIWRARLSWKWNRFRDLISATNSGGSMPDGNRRKGQNWNSTKQCCSCNPRPNGCLELFWEIMTFATFQKICQGSVKFTG